LSSEGLSSGVIWSLYADTKWQALEEITAASVDNPDFRDAFAHFFTVCGDALRGEYDNSAMMIAAASKGRQIPQTVIKCDGMAPGTCGGSSRSYEWARGSLAQTMVSQPSSLKNILGNSFSSLQGSFGSYAADFVSRDVLSCEDYLFFMMQGLRLEAAFKYEGLYRSTVPDMLPMNRISVDPESTLISTLFYGWDIREGRDWSDPYTESSAGTLLDLEQRRRFAYQLILLHLFRNEYMLVKEIAPLRQSNTEKTQQNTELVLKTTSAKSKFSELYTWSLMLPYLQGTLLYFLAIAYPFACILVVVPGWHKAVFTWMSFWAWAKMWDLGFALVKALERSIWAMTSFGGNVKYLSDRIVDVDERVGRPLTACSGDPMCPVPLVTLIEESINSGTYEDISNKTWYLFDQALLMTRALNLDLANSYYIYIMAGLYMSIPAVTGQIVLGARAGAASMVNSMIGGVASDAGRGASSAYQGDTSMKLRSNAGTIAQGSEALAMAKQGFAGQALGYAVKGLEEGRAGQEAQAGISGLSRINGQLQSSKDAKSVDARALAISGNGLADFGAAGGKAYASRQAAKAGQLPGPQGQQRGNGGEDAPGGWMGMAQAGTKGAFSAGEAWYMADVTDDYNQANRGISAQQAGLENRAFEANANSAQLRQAEGNMRSFADFSAKEAAWQTRNAFANQVGGWSAALGIQTGNVDPGSKPTDMVGFAMSGRLMKGDGSNEAGKHAWHLDWNTAGGHKQGTSDATAALNGRYGPDAVNNSYLGGFNGWGGVGGNAADHSVVKAGIQGGVNAMTSSSSDKPPRSSQ
jgi:hypothetical protein